MRLWRMHKQSSNFEKCFKHALVRNCTGMFPSEVCFGHYSWSPRDDKREPDLSACTRSVLWHYSHKNDKTREPARSACTRFVHGSDAASPGWDTKSWAPHIGADPKTVHALCMRCLSTLACVKNGTSKTPFLKSVPNMRLWRDAQAIYCETLTAASPSGIMGADPIKPCLLSARCTSALNRIFRHRVFGKQRLEKPHLPGCLALHESEGVRTVGPLHLG